MPPSPSRSDDDTDRGQQVVIVEDNPDTALLIEHALSGPDIDVEILSFRSGEAALDRLLGTGDDPPLAPLPSLILLDLQLPRVDGLEVLERLRAEPRTQQVPVVVFTSSDERKDLEACYARGANSYIRKPVDFDRFTRTLSKVASYWLSTNELAYDPTDPAGAEDQLEPGQAWDRVEGRER